MLSMTTDDTAAVERRAIFISHAHADRELARALAHLIDRTYSNVLETFLSSDPRPGSGLQPGDQWFPRIHAELNRSLAVWVLATPQSIDRAWVYWEAGIGSVQCPGGVVVLRVGLDQLPSPLSAFLAFDGSGTEDNGIATLIDKVADQLGMTIDSVLRQSAVDEWIAFIESYTPAPDLDDEASPVMTPEQLGRLESALARAEVAARLPVRQLLRLEAAVARAELALERLSFPPLLGGFPQSGLVRGSRPFSGSIAGFESSIAAARLAPKASFFIAYGTGLSVGDVVGVYIAGKYCGDIVASEDGSWVGQVGPDGADASACDAADGDELAFTLNGKPTNETETYSTGGLPADVANGISLSLAKRAPEA